MQILALPSVCGGCWRKEGSRPCASQRGEGTSDLDIQGAQRLTPMTSAELLAAQPSPVARWVDYASGVLQASGPPLLFGLRLWASVCLALYVAFWLELDNAQ